MDEQALTLLATLKRTAATVDAKLALFNALKSEIKHQSVPESSQPTILECLKLAITSQISTSLVSAGFSTLKHLIKRLQQQDQTNVIHSQGTKLFPALLDRLGDPRESHRAAASQALSDFYPYCTHEVERAIRDTALVGSNARAKEAAMRWVERMSKDEGLQFRSFVPHLVDCLEDADGTVRETARNVIVELFRHAQEHAKADLKRQLNAHNVRAAISSQILSQLDPPHSAEPDFSSSIQSASTLGHSTGGPPKTSEHPPPTEAALMEPLYVHTQRELEGIFQEMQPHFAGRESEANWQFRDNDVTKLRRLISGNAPTDYHAAFLAGIKGLLDGILNVANSLRTTVSSNGCHLFQDLAKALGPSIDPMVEIILQNFIKMCAATKNIMAQNGNTTVEALLSHASYNIRQMQHIWSACQDKNVQPRTFSTGWLKTLLKRQSQNKVHFEHTGALELAEKCIKAGLADASPKVKEGMRSTFWTFAGFWPEKAEAIMETLDPKARQLLERDPANPNPPSMSASLVESHSASVNPRLKAASSRSSLKETIAAQKKAAARRLPERPSSAMATFSPVRPALSTSNLRQASTLSSSTGQRVPSAVATTLPRQPPATTANAVPAAPTASGASGSLLSGPLRRPRRPEGQRPATADPYANRRPIRIQTPPISPARSPKKGDSVVPSVAVPGTSQGPSAKTPSPRTSPSKEKPLGDIGNHYPSIEEAAETDADIETPLGEENFTMILPNLKSPAATSSRVGRPAGSPSSGEASVNSIGKDLMGTRMPSLRFPHGTQPPPPTPSNFSVMQLGQTAASDSRHSPLMHGSRHGSPLKVANAKKPVQSIEDSCNSPVKVFEDPFTATEQVTEPVVHLPEKAVLEELPLNEKSLTIRPSAGDEHDYPESPTKQLKTPRAAQHGLAIDSTADGARMSPVQDRSEIIKARRLLVSGIDRIRAKNLDTHGFRKLQDLVKGNRFIWGEDAERFGDLLLALVEYLETPAEKLGTSQVKVVGLKTQVLATIRAILALHRREIAPYISNMLKAMLIARGQFEGSSHIAADLQKTGEELVDAGRVVECVNTVLDVVDTATSPTPQTVTMSLNILCRILRASQSSHSPLEVSTEQERKLASVAVRYLDDVDPDVRRVDTEFCLEMHDWFEKEEPGQGKFWERVGVLEEGRKNLITYYMARRERQHDVHV